MKIGLVWADDSLVAIRSVKQSELISAQVFRGMILLPLDRRLSGLPPTLANTAPKHKVFAAQFAFQPGAKRNTIRPSRNRTTLLDQNQLAVYECLNALSEVSRADFLEYRALGKTPLGAEGDHAAAGFAHHRELFAGRFFASPDRSQRR